MAHSHSNRHQAGDSSWAESSLHPRMEIWLQVPMLEKLKRASPILVVLALVQLGQSGVTKLVGVWLSPRLVGYLDDPIL